MPWIMPAHQAPVLPLKLWKPHWFSGLALCLGTMAPDLEFIFRLDHQWAVSHTLAAQLYFTVPLVLVLHALATSLVLPWLLPRLPLGPPLHFEELRALRPAADLRGWLVVALSGLIGGLSHVALDGFTHGNRSGWAVAALPFLRTPVPHFGGPVPLHDALQFWLTIGLGAFALLLWRRTVRRGLLWSWRGERPTPIVSQPAPEKRRLAAWAGLWALCGAAAAQALRPTLTEIRFVSVVAFGALTFAAFGLILAAALDRGGRPQDAAAAELPSGSGLAAAPAGREAA